MESLKKKCSVLTKLAYNVNFPINRSKGLEEMALFYHLCSYHIDLGFLVLSIKEHPNLGLKVLFLITIKL